MTIKERTEFTGFTKAKRQMCDAIESRIDTLEETRGDYIYIYQREAKIAELERMRDYIKNVCLYHVESTGKQNEQRNKKTQSRKSKNSLSKRI